MYGPDSYGDVAQLGERSVRNAEVAGSNPVVSTSERILVRESFFYVYFL